MWFYFNYKYLKIFVSNYFAWKFNWNFSIFYFKESDFIKSNTILNRVASISLTDTTANNRMVTWVIGWNAFKEKPLFGYGQENFYQGFDKHYNTKNTEEWFDRCHNMICDRAITGGIIGLLGYLVMLLVPFIIL
jgi:O-antigen ligase